MVHHLKTNFIPKDSLKVNNRIGTSLIRLNIILYYSLSLNTCECLICQVYQYKIVIDWKIIHISFKNTSLDSVAQSPSEIPPRKIELES